VDRTRQRIGKLGEKLAEKFLVSRGFQILNRNFSTPFGEIDLIAKQNEYIVFLEVKTRISERFGPPLSSITGIKQKHISKNCQYYLKRYGLYEKPCRIDVIGISLNAREDLHILRHIRNAIKM
jgi:putative endonuclease